jgi:ADP-ribose pyrophosphatase YjhB (NUDIX family)
MEPMARKSADRREFPERPIVGVGGIAIEGDRVLLVQRAEEPLKGQWSIPGGALELGESLTDGVARELLEETGVAVQPTEVVEVLNRVLKTPDGRVKYHYVLIDYLCHPLDEASVPKAASDAGDARWIARADLGDYHLRPDMLEVIEKAFDMART